MTERRALFYALGRKGDVVAPRSAKKRRVPGKLTKLPLAVKTQLRASFLVYGPFVDADIIRTHCYADYLEIVGAEGEALDFDAYREFFVEVLGYFRRRINEATVKIFKDETLASVHPTLPISASPANIRTLSFNQQWIIKSPASDVDALTIHPFLHKVVEKAMNWKDVNSFSAIEAYLERLNERAARAAEAETQPEPKIVTLQQLAPLIVVTIAVLASAGIASTLDVDCTHAPPIQELYNEALAALNDSDGILGRQFAEDSRTLLADLPHKRVPPRVTEPASSVPRDPLLGLPLAAFIRHV
ncbi:hypothetical protein H9P43_006207 [Blastocladiella emersonii ATCC 22665]|nr:hypothetical protein H9P43_006207 [Blastocladiella emersonii ATCC 22665]